ncbi:MAG: MATE family efflux transporter [Lachnospiraceae bacterium]|nr:MATE family efflux transporter [Lachnospiraceae bacterium]
MTKAVHENNFTSGPIAGPLIRFALPVLLALFLQSMYGAVDLLIVGLFAESSDISAVATGSQFMHTMTGMIAGLSMGTTILLGQQIGEGRGKEGGKTVGASIVLFLIVAAVMSVTLVCSANGLARLLQAPEEAYPAAVSYLRICGAGSAVIIAYNLIGSIFRGIGDSKTPLITVAIACVCNILGDLLLVGVFHMGTAGAAYATVAAQAISVIMSFLIIRKKTLPFSFSKEMIRPDMPRIKRVCFLGIPIALQDLLVGISFLVIQAIVNTLGVIPSAGVGVAEKMVGFIMLVPSAFMQSLSAFVAQNIGAGRRDRAEKTLQIGIGLSFAVGVLMAVLSFFFGKQLSGLFTKDAAVIAASADYLKAYAIDCLLTPVFFCFIGFYNGIGLTAFVMLQGIVSAFLVRVPVSFLMSRRVPVSLFHIGLATPASSLLQIVMCLICMMYVKKKYWKQ